MRNLSNLFITPALAQRQAAFPLEIGISANKLIEPITSGKLIVPIDIGGGAIRPPVGCSHILAVNGAWRINRTTTNCFYLNNGLKGKIYTEADGRYRLNIYGTINTSDYNSDTNLNYKVSVYNSLGKKSEKNFTIKLKSNPPQLDFSCNKKAGLYQSYSCQVNNLNTKNQSTTYSYSHIDSAGLEGLDLPSGFVGDPNTGLISGMPVNIGNYKFKITAYNEYGASAEKEYDLTVESFCGQQLVQYPGGPWNQTGEVKNQGGYYKTVLIGGQCWLADNLNVPYSYSYPVNNSETIVDIQAKAVPKSSWWQKALALLFRPFPVLAQISNQIQIMTNIGVCYNNDNTYCEAEGRLYKASEVMANSVIPSSRGICPTGYHIPSQEEYATLVGSFENNPGDNLRQNGDSGFEAFLTGSAETGVTSTIFYDRNSFSSFWSSTIGNTGNWYRLLGAGSSFDEFQAANDSKLYSLRCIQDKPCPTDCASCNTAGVCCEADSWSPATNTKCGTFIQTDNCGNTRNAAGTMTCTAPNVCGAGNVCGPCVANCTGKICGSNGCGGSCGTCSLGYTCSASGTSCVPPPCVPDCFGKICGPNGCGGYCGTCPTNYTCAVGGASCTPPCVPSCAGKVCGDNGCPGSAQDACGQCDQGYSCSAAGLCIQDCQPDCQQANCNNSSDGCGGTCPGTQCDQGQICLSNGACVW